MDRGASTIRVVKHLQRALPSEGLLEASMNEPRDEPRDESRDESRDELCHATWGVIQGLSLPSLLQMLNMERKTCTIRVSSGRRMGFFYVREGQIINARFRNKEGMEAVQELIGATAPKMEIDGQLHDPTQQIDLRLEEILMQTAQHQDEAAFAVPAGPSLDRGEESDAIPVSEIGKWREPARPRARPAASRWRLPLGIGLVVLGLLAGTGWLLFPRTVVLEVLSTPLGATVDLNGRALGVTPLHLDLPSPPQGTLTLQRSGYQSLEHTLRPDDHSLNLALQALPPPPPVLAPDPVVTPTPTRLEKAPPKTKLKPRQDPKSLPTRDIFDQLRKPGD